MRYAIYTLFVGLLSISSAACMPFAIATPPIHASLTGGGQYTSAASSASLNDDDDVGNASASGLGGHLSVEGAFAPLQLWGSSDRSFDLGFGYGARFRFGERNTNFYGPYMELGALLVSDRLYGRHGLKLQARALSASGYDGFSGFGASLSWHIEGASWLKGEPFDSCDNDGCIFGLAFGESAAGFEVKLGVDQVRDQTDWFLGVGFTFRLPALLAAGFAWVL